MYLVFLKGGVVTLQNKGQLTNLRKHVHITNKQIKFLGGK